MKYQIDETTLSIMRKIDEALIPDAMLETMHGVYRKEYVEDLQDCRWSLDVTALVNAEVAA